MIIDEPGIVQEAGHVATHLHTGHVTTIDGRIRVILVQHVEQRLPRRR